MSIIEKAVAKLRSDGPAVGKKDQQHVESPGNSQCSERDANQKTKASLSPPLVAEAEKPQQLKTPAAVQTVRSMESEPIISKKPDLEIMALNIDGLLTGESERTRHAEEMRMIKRPILQSSFGKKNKPSEHSNLLMVTSALAGEGKTFTSLNLALSIAAEMDRTVLIVDADLAKPGLSRLLKIDDKPGLTNYLREEQKDIGALLMRTDIPKLTVLPAGSLYAHSTELLASNHMKQLFHELAVRYPDRLVLFDSPPLLETTEATVLANYIGQILLVVAFAATPQQAVKEALDQLDSLDNVSLVLNKCKKSFMSTQMGSYGYGYGSDSEQ